MAQYEDEAFLEAIRDHERAPGAGVSTPEIAEVVGCTRPTASIRLHKLEDEGKVEIASSRGANYWTVTENT